MEIQIYNTLPPQGRQIREDVFVREQGFQEEFDTIDGFATHILVSVDTFLASEKIHKRPPALSKACWRLFISRCIALFAFPTQTAQ